MDYRLNIVETLLFCDLKRAKEKNNFKDNLGDKLMEEIGELELAIINYKMNPTIQNHEEIYKETADVYIILKQLNRDPTENLLGKYAYDVYMGSYRSDMVKVAIVYKIVRTVNRINEGYYN